jgi:hypothetical protein
VAETVGGNDGRERRARMASEVVGASKVAAVAVRRLSAWPVRLCSDCEADGWAPRAFDFFLFIQNHLIFKNSKWVSYLTPKIPNFCMWLSWDSVNNFLNFADNQFPA